MRPSLPTPLGDVPLPMPLALFILVVAVALAVAFAAAGPVRRARRGRRHRAAAAAVPPERLLRAGNTPPAGIAVPPDRWVDPYLLASVRRHPCSYPLPDAVPAPLDDMVSEPRHAADPAPVFVPAQRATAPLFDDDATQVLGIPAARQATR